MSETKLTIAVADYLRGDIHKGKSIIKVAAPFPDLLWTFVANEGRDAASGAKFQRFGVRRGVADFMLWWPNGKGAIELKFESGKQSAYQKDFQYRFEQVGGYYAVCRSVKEVRDTLISWGLECKNMNCIEPQMSFEKRIAIVHNMNRPID